MMKLVQMVLISRRWKSLGSVQSVEKRGNWNGLSNGHVPEFPLKAGNISKG